ncbi:hypothetical protein M569_15639 [Genlisea aurea]|uniref:Peripheral-type benzodiazepine receptor n=1 Tax=Genlisea aurea TaxID=192259 RepID=S8C412_9LAMI|nr:hypothetical protein M569_15639 [Genlisea aurea]
MASAEGLTHRPKQDQDRDRDQTEPPSEMDKKKPPAGRASRGLLSLTIAIALPLSLSLLDIVFVTRHRSLQKPFYFPPIWSLHLACLTAACFSGLSAWMVWADGGFHRRPAALGLWLGELLLSLVWYPVVFLAGASRVGLALCAALLVVLFLSSRMFWMMNPIAGDLVKPCFLWAFLLSVFNLRLLYV